MNKSLASRFKPPVHLGRALGIVFTAVVLPACLVLLAGCLSRPALNTQTFSFDLPAVAATNADAPVLGIKTVTVAAPFADRALVYRTGEFNYERDPYAQFLDFPERELMASVRAGLCSQGDFSSAVMAGAALAPDIMVEVNVSQLFGDFREQDNSKAILRAQFIFYQATNGIAARAILKQEYARSIPIGKPTAAALMAGWNQALDEIFGEALADYRLRKN